MNQGGPALPFRSDRAKVAETMVKPKSQKQTESKKMDKYVVNRHAVANREGGEETSKVAEPSLDTIMARFNSQEPAQAQTGCCHGGHQPPASRLP
ncbi:hypothetical protein NDU88_001971 [Pleurodeles waltl]|uniref:Uncharacterized protein n=1 Tax=Pleurodeles waltl TaxID=8319 RepID=A0AAV7WP04_PLEWA|nr:hypothetical protein NDU88_001971 [Pleurodeles waltl]